MVTGGMQETDGDIGSGKEPVGPGLGGTICVSHLRTLRRGKSSPPPPVATLRKISEIWGQNQRLRAQIRVSLPPITLH